jgi:hypothetical protein
LKDVITGDEMFSDAFPIKTVEDIVYEVDCQLIEVKPGVDVGALRLCHSLRKSQPDI